MKKPAQRAKRLYEVQHQLLRMELLKLETARQAVAQAEKTERDALSLLGAGNTPAIPPQIAARVAAAARAKVQTHNASLKTQTEKTVDQAGKESAAKRNLEAEKAELAKEEAKRALEEVIEALLTRNRA